MKRRARSGPALSVLRVHPRMRAVSVLENTLGRPHAQSGSRDLSPVSVMPHVPTFPFLFGSAFPPPPSCRSSGQEEANASLNEAVLGFSTKAKDVHSAAPVSICDVDRASAAPGPPPSCVTVCGPGSRRRKAGPCLMESHPVDTKERLIASWEVCACTHACTCAQHTHTRACLKLCGRPESVYFFEHHFFTWTCRCLHGRLLRNKSFLDDSLRIASCSTWGIGGNGRKESQSHKVNIAEKVRKLATAVAAS